jgi:hypothetical protein
MLRNRRARKVLGCSREFKLVVCNVFRKLVVCNVTCLHKRKEIVKTVQYVDAAPKMSVVCFTHSDSVIMPENKKVISF